MSSRREDEDLGLAADEPLCAFVDQVRSTYAFGPPPQIGPGLAAVLTRGLGTGGPAEGRLPAPTAGPARRAWRLADALQGRRARLGLGAAVASLTFLGTGVAGALPGPAQAAFERTADVVGIELPETARRDPAPAPAEAESEPGADPTSPTGRGDAPDSPGVGSGGENPDPGSSPPPVAGRPDNAPPAAPQPGPPGDAGGAGEGLGREPGQGRPDGVPAPTGPESPRRPGAGPPPGVPGPVGNANDEADIDEAGKVAGRGNATAAGPRAAGGTGRSAGGPPPAAGPGGISGPADAHPDTAGASAK